MKLVVQLCIIPILLVANPWNETDHRDDFFLGRGCGGGYARNLLIKVKKHVFINILYVSEIPYIPLNYSMKFCDCKFRN